MASIPRHSVSSRRFPSALLTVGTSEKSSRRKSSTPETPSKSETHARAETTAELELGGGRRQLGEKPRPTFEPPHRRVVVGVSTTFAIPAARWRGRRSLLKS